MKSGRVDEEGSALDLLRSRLGGVLGKVATLGVEVPDAAEPTLLRYCEFLLRSREAVSKKDRTPEGVLAHLEDCAAVIEVCPDIAVATTVCDLGSGNGLPGIVVAALVGCYRRPSGSTDRPAITLLERSARRRALLKRLSLELGLDVKVEESEGAGTTHEVVLMRAVVPLPEAPGLAVRHVRRPGTCVVWAGDPGADIRSAFEDACRRSGVVGEWKVPRELRSRGKLVLMRATGRDDRNVTPSGRRPVGRVGSLVDSVGACIGANGRRTYSGARDARER